MLPKQHRLPASQIPTVAKLGKTIIQSDYFFVKFLNTNEAVLPLMAVSVSAKIDKRAVVRNRIKRLLRAVFMQKIDSFRPGSYLIVVKSAKLAELTSEEVTKLL